MFGFPSPDAPFAQAPAGWRVRIDRSPTASDPDDVPELKVMTMGKGFHVAGGPAGTFWNPANRANGNFTVRATFNLMKPSGHTNYYGLIFAGEDLEAPTSATSISWLHRTARISSGSAWAKVVDVQRGPHAAVQRPGANGSSSNRLEVRVSATNVAYMVNGTVVHTTPKTGATAQTDGLVGVRINHVLDVHVEAFEVVRQ